MVTPPDGGTMILIQTSFLGAVAQVLPGIPTDVVAQTFVNVVYTGGPAVVTVSGKAPHGSSFAIQAVERQNSMLPAEELFSDQTRNHSVAPGVCPVKDN